MAGSQVNLGPGYWEKHDNAPPQHTTAAVRHRVQEAEQMLHALQAREANVTTDLVRSAAEFGRAAAKAYQSAPVTALLSELPRKFSVQKLAVQVSHPLLAFALPHNLFSPPLYLSAHFLALLSPICFFARFARDMSRLSFKFSCIIAVSHYNR